MGGHFEREQKQIEAERLSNKNHWIAGLLAGAGLVSLLTGYPAGAGISLAVLLAVVVGSHFQDKQRLRRAAKMDNDDKAGRAYKL
jgi:hypothetical protein